MRRVRVSLGIVFISLALLVLGLPNAPTALAAGSQVVSGRALDADGQPIVGLKVQLFEFGANPAEEPPVSSAVTTAAGTYEVTAPTPAPDIANPYDLVLGWGGDYVPVTTTIGVFAGADLAVDDISLHMVYATGRVSDYKGRPVQGVKVSSHIWSAGSWEWFSGDETTITDADGNYRVQLRPLAQFTVRFDITDASWVYLGGSSEDPVPGNPTSTRDATDSDVTGLDVQLPETHKLKAGLSTPYSETVSGAFVALYAANHQPGDDILFSLDEVSSGRFQTDVPPGDYDLVVDSSGASPNVQPVTRGIWLADDLDLGTLTLQLTDPSITGRVFDRYGSPLAGAAAARFSGAVQGDIFAPEGSVLLTRGDGGFGWSVNHPWNQVTIGLTGCPGVTTPKLDVSGGSVADRGIRLDCGAKPVPAPPTITGSPTVGATLTVVPTTVGPNFASVGYEWLRDDAVVGSGLTYLVSDADRGHQITVRQTLRHDAVEGFGGTVTFDPFDVTSAAAGVPLFEFQAAPAPGVAGKAVIGSTLTATAGTWAPAPSSLSYQWLRSGTAIPGATASTYKVQKADAGATIAVRVTAAKAGYTTAVRTSGSTAKVPFLKLTAGKATVSGKAKVGRTLKAGKGKWKPSGISFSYQWFVGGRLVAGATKSSYRPVAADRGRTIKVAITGSKVGYKTVTKTSKSTRKVT